jgi:hypothetical protein
MRAVVDSSILTQYPACATSREVKLGSLDAAGGPVRRVRCRTVWRGKTLAGELAAAGQRTVLAHARQTAAVTPVRAQSSKSAEAQMLGLLLPAQTRSADNLASVLDALVRDPGVHAPVMNATRLRSAPVDRSEPIAGADTPSLAPMDHNASQNALRIRAEPWAHGSHPHYRDVCYSPFNGGGAACQPDAPDSPVSRAGPDTLCRAPRVRT